MLWKVLMKFNTRDLWQFSLFWHIFVFREILLSRRVFLPKKLIQKYFGCVKTRNFKLPLSKSFNYLHCLFNFATINAMSIFFLTFSSLFWSTGTRHCMTSFTLDKFSIITPDPRAGGWHVAGDQIFYFTTLDLSYSFIMAISIFTRSAVLCYQFDSIVFTHWAYQIFTPLGCRIRIARQWFWWNCCFAT